MKALARLGFMDRNATINATVKTTLHVILQLEIASVNVDGWVARVT